MLRRLARHTLQDAVLYSTYCSYCDTLDWCCSVPEQDLTFCASFAPALQDRHPDKTSTQKCQKWLRLCGDRSVTSPCLSALPFHASHTNHAGHANHAGHTISYHSDRFILLHTVRTISYISCQLDSSRLATPP